MNAYLKNARLIGASIILLAATVLLVVATIGNTIHRLCSSASAMLNRYAHKIAGEIQNSEVTNHKPEATTPQQFINNPPIVWVGTLPEQVRKILELKGLHVSNNYIEAILSQQNPLSN